jgi:hypothetical protein
MSYCVKDLTQVENTISQLTRGEKLTSFSRSTAAGSQTVTLNQTQISDLECLG